MRRYLLSLFALCVLGLSAQQRTVRIVHTADAHSCVDPISPTHNDTAQADKGGFLRRAALVRQLRSEGDDLLLMDCGDFSQGSVYYNLFRGEVEVSLMNEMAYDVATLGNHEFDFGLDNLAQLLRKARFPFVCCNYDFTGTPCEGLLRPYVVLERAGVRIGVFGVCPKPEGLILAKNYEPMKYTDPALAAQPVIDRLRGQEQCDVVVCLSHLGWSDGEGYDADFVRRTTGIDVLLGGHSHTYFEHPGTLKDAMGHEVITDHEGKNARFVGLLRIEVGE